MTFTCRGGLKPTLPSEKLANPLVAQTVIASGPAGWWGWPKDTVMEGLREQFAQASDPARRTQLAAEIQARAYDVVAYIPGGEVMTTSAIGNRVDGALDALWCCSGI